MCADMFGCHSRALFPVFIFPRFLTKANTLNFLGSVLSFSNSLVFLFRLEGAWYSGSVLGPLCVCGFCMCSWTLVSFCNSGFLLLVEIVSAMAAVLSVSVWHFICYLICTSVIVYVIVYVFMSTKYRLIFFLHIIGWRLSPACVWCFACFGWSHMSKCDSCLVWRYPGWGHFSWSDSGSFWQWFLKCLLAFVTC